LGDVAPADIKTSIYNTLEPNIGTGPYKFVEYVEGEYFELEANPDYYGGEPEIKRIILPIIPDPSTALAAIENHEVDILSWTYGASFVPEIARLQEKTDINAVASFDRPGFKHIATNTMNPILANKWVRKALAHTIPYDRVVNEVMLGLVEQANSLVPPSHPFYNADVPFYTHDLDQAREYLRMAGYPEWTSEPAVVETQTDMTTIAISVIAGAIAGAVVGFLVGKRQ
jgi:ABC-type transport system substrate-binding protein